LLPATDEELDIITFKEVKPDKGNEIILIVEDEPDVLEIAKAILIEYGYSIYTALNGEEAIRVYKKRSDEIQMIFTDVIMPKMGGKELFEKLHSSYPDLKFLFTSGYSMETMDEEFVEKENLKIIQKPYHPNVLISEIQQILSD